MSSLLFAPPLMGAAAAAESPVNVTDWNFEALSQAVFPTTPSCYATMVIKNNGDISMSATGDYSEVGGPAADDWYRGNPVASIGDGYEVRVTETSGTFTTGTVGSWLALTSDRTWTFDKINTVGSYSVSFTIEIRPTSGSVISTSSHTITHTMAFA